MNFVEAIKRYQETGERGAIDMIREAMNYDYLRSPTGMEFPKPEMYVAFRCLRLIGGRLATIKYTLSEHGLSSRRDSPEYIFTEYAGGLRQWTGIELTPGNFTEYEPYLRSYFGPTFPDLMRAYKQIIGEQETIWHRLTGVIVDEHWPALQEALEYAMQRVNTSRTEREIVRYINRATRTGYVRSQFDGMRRVRRGGEAKYVEPKYHGADYAVFGKVTVDYSGFTDRQRQLLGRIYAIIEKDYAEGRIGSYAVDMRGGYRIVNRHIAEKLGMHEASLSRALKGIRGVKH